MVPTVISRRMEEELKPQLQALLKLTKRRVNSSIFVLQSTRINSCNLWLGK
jgi:hypothetical protein